MGRDTTESTRLVACPVEAGRRPNTVVNLKTQVRIIHKTRWYIRAVDTAGHFIKLPVLSEELFNTYTEAVRAIEEYEDG